MLFPKRDVTTDASRVILPKRVDVVTHRAGWSACLLPVAALHRDIGRSKYTVHALHASHISSRRWRCRGRHEKRKKNIGLAASAKPGEEEAWGQKEQLGRSRTWPQVRAHFTFTKACACYPLMRACRTDALAFVWPLGSAALSSCVTVSVSISTLIEP